MYKVLCTFADLLDNRHVYNEGDEYPRKGYSPSSERIEELSTAKNKVNRPLIVLIQEPSEETVEKPVEETVAETPVEDAQKPVEAVDDQEAIADTVEENKPSRGRRKAK